MIPYKVTKVTTKSYQGYYWKPEWPKMGQNSIIRYFFSLKKKASAEGRSPQQELKVSPRSGPYLLVFFKDLNKFLEKKKILVLSEEFYTTINF